MQALSIKNEGSGETSKSELTFYIGVIFLQDLEKR